MSRLRHVATSRFGFTMARFSSKQATTLALALFALVRRRRLRRKLSREGRQWVAPHVRERDGQGAFMHLVPGLREREEHVFKNFLRMPPVVFDWLLELVTPIIVKQDTRLRASISPAERLTITLRFLATGLLWFHNYCQWSSGGHDPRCGERGGRPSTQ